MLGMLYGVYHTCKLYRRSRAAMDSASHSGQTRFRTSQVQVPTLDVGEDGSQLYRYGSVARDGSVIISVPDMQARGEATSWAQRMMSGDRSSFTPSSTPSRRNDKPKILIPVKQTICILEPDGKHSLGISHRQKDSTIQVRPEDLGIERTYLERSMSVGEELIHTLQTAPGSTAVVVGSRHEGGLSLYGTDACRHRTNSSRDDISSTPPRSSTREDQPDVDDECPNSSIIQEDKKKKTRRRKKKKRRRHDAWCQVNMELQ